MALRGKKLQILRALQKLRPDDQAMDAHGIIVACGGLYCMAHTAHTPLRELHAAGLILVDGEKRPTGRRWRITDKGRAALSVAITKRGFLEGDLLRPTVPARIARGSTRQTD
jgi:hypothetical protein